ncbi:MAG: hypothetical protein ACYTBJ_25590 [Planctomycetota bacterium]|jgi:hypothetical protein
MTLGLVEKPTKQEEEKLLRLYELTIEQEKYFLSEHQKRVAFYTGLISTLVVATVAGLLKCNRWYHYTALTAGPISVAFISHLAKRGADRLYQRFLETITMIKKIEYDLGWRQERNRKPSEKDDWLANECLLPMRYLKAVDPSKSKDSEQWVTQHMIRSEKGKRNYNGVATMLFTVVKWAAIVGTCILVPVVYVKLTKQHPTIGRTVCNYLTAWIDSH